MIDYANKDYLRETPEQRQAQKLADANEWLRRRGKHCLEVPLKFRIYQPSHGQPMEPMK